MRIEIFINCPIHLCVVARELLIGFDVGRLPEIYLLAFFLGASAFGEIGGKKAYDSSLNCRDAE